MARRRLIIHGSQEELDMFEPIYNTRVRLQHGAASSRFQLPDPPPAEDSEHEDEPGADHSITQDSSGNVGADHHVDTDSCNWRRDVDEEDDDAPHSEEERVGSVNNDLQEFNIKTRENVRKGQLATGNGSETQACPESDTNTDSDSDSDSDS